jgi:hypothetical protein
MKHRPHRELLIAGTSWGLSATAFGILFTEYALQGLGPDVRGVARIVANITTGFTLIGVLGMALGFAALVWMALRWIDVDAGFDVVVTALWPGFAVLAAYSAAGAVTVWLAPSPHPPPDVLENWSGYQASLMRSYPLAAVAQARTLAMVAAGAAVWASVKRRVRCSWWDAGIGVGAGLSVMAVLATLINAAA